MRSCPPDPLTCDTGSAAARDLNCATLYVVPDATTRDLVLREGMKWEGVPQTMVAGGNWVVDLCDHSLAPTVAREVCGTVVSYDGS